MLQIMQLLNAWHALMCLFWLSIHISILCTAEAQMRALLSALEYGLAATEVEVVQASLEALAALARYHQAATAAGAPGIADAAGAMACSI